MKPWSYVWTWHHSRAHKHQSNRASSSLPTVLGLNQFSVLLNIIRGRCISCLQASVMVPPIVSERYCSALERASNLAIDINPTALPAVRRQIKVLTDWLSVVRQLQSVHNPDPKVQTSPWSHTYWVASSLQWDAVEEQFMTVGCRLCAAGGRLMLGTYRASGNCILFFQQVWLKKKGRKKDRKTISLNLCILI